MYRWKNYHIWNCKGEDRKSNRIDFKFAFLTKHSPLPQPPDNPRYSLRINKTDKKINTMNHYCIICSIFQLIRISCFLPLLSAFQTILNDIYIYNSRDLLLLKTKFHQVENTKTCLVLVFPPAWRVIPVNVCPHLIVEKKQNIPPVITQTEFQKIRVTKFHEFLKIYSDGPVQAGKATAAVVIP